MAFDLLSIALGAVVGGTGTLVTSRLTTAEARRTAGWNAWLAQNDAVRGADAYQVAAANGGCEIAWAYAGVPDELFEASTKTAGWYRRYLAVYPAGTVAAPSEMYEVHQSVVGGLRYYLKRPWWKPKGRRSKQIAALTASVALLEPVVELFLGAIEVGAAWPGDAGSFAEWFGEIDEGGSDNN